MLVPRMKRQELKKEETMEKGEDDEDEDRIKGKYTFNIAFPCYSPLESKSEQQHCTIYLSTNDE